MQVSTEKTGDLARRLTVEVAVEDIDRQINQRLGELRGKVRLKGFRPGKVPMNVVRQRYGAQVREEVQAETMQSALQDAIREQSLRVAGISSLAPDGESDEGGFRFIADVEVYPELDDLDVSAIEIERPAVTIAEQDVDDMIQTLREQRRSFTAVERPAADGDRVKIDYHVEADGLRVPGEGERSIQPVLGSGALFEAFEQVVLGVSAGEEKTAEIEFPEDFPEAALAGSTGTVHLKVTAVEASEMPEVDDDFAASFGIEGGVEQMRADVRRNLEREMRSARINHLKRAVSEKLAERFADFTLPETAVRQEMQQMVGQLRQQYGQQINLTEEQIRPGAERRVRLGFILAEIARANDLEIDPERVQQHIDDIADTYENPSEVVEVYRANPQLMGQVENAVLEEQVIDWVLANATVTESEFSFKQLMETA
ncbi:MAG: trigger factor [Wenzhouxiangellaceae bacterium]|nr:trigger factor [Wenzhouxiangellaceae bacterium]